MLLEAVGPTCAGAVQLLPREGQPSGLDCIEATPLSDTSIGRLPQVVVAKPLPGDLVVDEPGLRLSNARAQGKMALLWHQFCIPVSTKVLPFRPHLDPFAPEMPENSLVLSTELT